MHSWSSQDGERNQRNDQLLNPFLLLHVFIVVNKPIDLYNFSLSASFLSGATIREVPGILNFHTETWNKRTGC